MKIKEIIWTIIIISMVILGILAGLYLLENFAFQEKLDLNQSRDFYFNKSVTGTLPTNLPIIIYCDYYQYSKGQEYVSEFVWIYPICAMLETNSELELYNYDIKFKEYNLCIYLMNNKSVGKCEGEQEDEKD